VPGIPFDSMWAHDDDSVYLHDLGSGQIMAVTVRDGTERWRIDQVGEVYAAGAGRVLVAGGALPGPNDLIGLSALDGTVAWTTPLPLVESAYATSAAVDEDLAVVAISALAPRD
jgi:outer membrane protein assembly factor BamB